jgi:hypothetical protein
VTFGVKKHRPAHGAKKEGGTAQARKFVTNPFYAQIPEGCSTVWDMSDDSDLELELEQKKDGDSEVKPEEKSDDGE